MQSFTRLALSVIVAASASAQQPVVPTPPQLELDSLLKAHSHQLRSADGKTNESGYSFLLNEIGDAQVVAIAEEHNTAEIPVFATDLFQRLHRTLDFNYFADEQDPYTLQLVSAARRGSMDDVTALARKWPTAFTFATDEELQMLFDIARTSTGKSNPLWGVDQAFGAAHYLQRLKELAPNDRARAAVDSLMRIAEPMERARYDTTTRHYIAEVATEDDFARLGKLFNARAGSEAAWLIQALTRSAHIYTAYVLAATKGQPTGWENGWSRERYMKERFSEEYHLAVARGDTLPRVMIKAGHWHIHRGIYPGSMALTLGNFASELAQFNGKTSYVITTGITGPPGQWRLYSSPVQKTVPPLGWTLVDLRALRPYARGSRIRDMTSELRLLIFTADAALYFGGATPGKESLEEWLTRSSN